MRVEAEDLASTSVLSIFAELAEPDRAHPLIGDQEAGEVEVATRQPLAPHRPPKCCCLTENIGLKEVDVTNLPGRSMGLPNLFSICDSCLADDDHTLGHLAILLPGVCLGKTTRESLH